jgi:hypothetical protein
MDPLIMIGILSQRVSTSLNMIGWKQYLCNHVDETHFSSTIGAQKTEERTLFQDLG